MKQLILYYLRFLLPFAGVGLVGVLIFQAWAYRPGAPPAYSQFEILLSFVCTLVAVAFLEGDREDPQLEYLWSLPVSPARIFAAKFVLCSGAILILVAAHFLIEATQVFWFLDRAEPRHPYAARPGALRFHPLILLVLCFPVSIGLGESRLLRGVPRKILWPLLLILNALVPWIVLSLVYSRFLPAPHGMSFFDLEPEPGSAEFLNRYNESYRAGGASFWAFWIGYFAVAAGIGVTVAIQAARNYAGRLLAAELETEE